jgi:hypothetical protein
MNENLEQQILTKLDPNIAPSEERMRRMETMAWERLEEHRSSRARARRGVLVAGVVGGVAAGAIYGASALVSAPWLDDFLKAVHAHLMKLHELLFGTHR